MNLAEDYDLDLRSQPGDLTRTDNLPIISKLFIYWLTYYRPNSLQVI